MLKRATAILMMGLLACTNAVVYARGGGGPSGGMSSGHVSTEGVTNTNGPNAPDRDTGLSRAEDRMSAQGSAHEKAKAKHHKKHLKKHSKTTK